MREATNIQCAVLILVFYDHGYKTVVGVSQVETLVQNEKIQQG